MESIVQENYLKNLYFLSQHHGTLVRTNVLASRIHTSAAAVSDMLQKLHTRKLVHYERYRGARLSSNGMRMALNIVRKHRLWEVFLHDKLLFRSNQVHALAEELEHIHHTELIERLDAYLGSPKTDPHGTLIPTLDDMDSTYDRYVLTSLAIGERGRLIAFGTQDTHFLAYLERMHMALDDLLCVEAKENYDHSLQVSVGDAKRLCFLSEKVANHLYVRKV